MSVDRRKFMQLAGLGAIGLAGVTPKRLLGQEVTDSLKVLETHQRAQPLTAKRWAMVIDVRKCMAAKDCRP